LKIGHLATMAFSPLSPAIIFFFPHISSHLMCVRESPFISQISHRQHILLLLPFFFLMCFTIYMSFFIVSSTERRVLRTDMIQL
jgi:hypothetical protein